MAEDFNARVIREFRENAGKVGPPFTGLPMVLLHHVGARSGTERITPVRWFADGDRRFVVASAAGAPTHPAWYHNLMATPDVVVEIADGDGNVETTPVHAEDLTGDERDRLWNWILENEGGFAAYQRKVEGIRTIPLVALVPR